jgi:hypothetical protein
MLKPVVVRHWALVIVAECPACDQNATVLLHAGQVSNCPACSAPLACGTFSWDAAKQPRPHIAIGQAAPAPTLVS